MTEPLHVLYEDNHLLVVEKPANMPVQEDVSKDEDLLSVCKAKGYQRSCRILRLSGADGQSCQPEHPGKGREFFQVDICVSHGDVLRSDRHNCSCGR